jgi:hypothetical protein
MISVYPLTLWGEGQTDEYGAKTLNETPVKSAKTVKDYLIDAF